MSRMGSPKRHFIAERNAKETACHKDVKANLTLTVTLELARVTCANCLKNLAVNS